MQAGQRIKSWRERKGLTQADAAVALSVSQAMLSRWENGVYRPSTRSIVRIAEVTRIPVAKLLAE